MLSEQMQAVIKALWEQKPQSRGIEIPAEYIPMVRGIVDQQLAGQPTPADVRIEEKTIEGIGGEFYTYNSEDPEKKTDKIIYYIHGEGFENGTVKSRRYMATNLAHFAKMDCFSIDYTQWPEAMHPTALNECLKVFRSLAAHYGAENVLLSGESGGAVLSVSLCLYLRDHNEPLPGKIGAMGMVIDFFDNPPSRITNNDIDPMLASSINKEIRYFTDEQRKDPYVSVRYADLTGLPEILITVGTAEILYDDAMIFQDMLNKAGVKNELIIYDGLFHCFQLYCTPESEASLKTVGEFLGRR